MKKILWIEDQTETGMLDFRIWLERSGNYDLRIGRDAAEGIELLCQDVFDAIIVDIRILPGDNQNLINIYYNHSENGRPFEKMGIVVISEIFSSNPNILSQNKNPKKIGIISIEPFNEVQKLFEKFLIQEISNRLNYLFKIQVELPSQFEEFVIKLLLN